MLFMLMLLSDPLAYTLYPEKIYEPPKNVFMGLPADMVADGQGNLYALDVNEKTILMWDQDGRYKGRLGRGGQGPGEFSFISPAVSGLTYDGNYLIVLDDRKLHFFKAQTFAFSIQLPSQCLKFKALGQDKYLHLVSQEENGQNFNVLSFASIENQELVIEKEIVKIRNPMFTRNRGGGWDIRFGQGALSFSSQPGLSYFLVGNFKKPMIDLYGVSGQKLRSQRVSLFPKPFTEKMKADILHSYPWVDPPNKAIWPDETLAYHQHSVIDDKRWLVSQNFEGRSRGFIYTDQKVDTFTYDLHDGQYYIVSPDFIFAVQKDQEDYILKRMKLKVGSPN